MTASINANTTSGVVVTSDTSGALALQTAGTTALSISSAQAVSLTSGLAVTGSTTILKNGGTGATAGLFLSGGGASTNFNIDYGTVASNRLYMRQNYFDGSGNIKFQYSSDGTMASPSDILSVNWGGGIAVTGLTDISAATSGQIKFPASQNASSDANTLDDYEEGTWTPALTGGTLSINSATYTKIGNRVLLSMDIFVTSVPSGSNITVTGAPFNVSGIAISAIGGDKFYWTTNALIGMHGYMDSTSIFFFYFTSGSNGVRMTDSNIAVNTTIRCSFQYKT